MENTKPHYDDEIDLVEFFETLWDGKWKIILTTFVAAIFGVVFSVVKPNSFEVSTPFQSGKPSVFITYTSLNNLLKSNQFSFSVDENSIFKMFIAEFNDYEEMVDAVSTSEFVQKSIKDLDDDKQRALIDFAKAFELNAPSKNEENWTLSFEWHDDIEGAKLFNDAIRQTLSNIKNISVSNVNELAEAIDIRNTRNLEKLRNKLSLIEKNQIDINKKRIQYLREQSAIAKELGIETNRLDANALSQSSQNAISLSVNSNDVPFYLRGYKAIDKEVALIESRSDEEKLLIADGYIQIKEEIISLETDLSSSQLRNAAEVIANDNPNGWVQFDLSIADVKSQKKSMLYIALSIVLGGMVGVMYVLISNAVRKRKESSPRG
ncbi:MAG: Wzz/FepE/Etk N-terminal domain-containing protein [Alphaproteobacteria bacterium]|nr:Wzz/FepE/Etk N-terminal domain-containing protein [Alphaproteobacteria bacterium]